MENYSIIIILVTLVCSAFFSGSEIAFLQANKLKIEIDRKQGNFNAKILSSFVKHQSKFITTLLLGNNISLVLYGIFMGKVLIKFLFPDFYNFDNETAFKELPAYILLVQTLISTLIILLTAEFLPKTIFRINPNKILSVFAVPLLLIYIVLFPLTVIVSFLSNSILRLFGNKNSMEDVNFGRVDLDDYLNKKQKTPSEAEEEDYEVQIFHNALNFSKVKARDCMIPRIEIIALNIEDSVEDLIKEFIETGLSKILVFRDNIDNVIGYVHSFEMFNKPKTIKEILRPIGIVPESVPVNVLLEKFIKTKQGVSVVIDEFGGTSGIITMEDVVEEIFGEIEDEHDSEELIEEVKSKDEFIFSGRQEIEYLNTEYDLNLPESEEYETLAGLVVINNEDIPEQNEEIEIGEYVFKILECTNFKIETIRVIRKEK
jgi:CBS domain containing-hemolysin-like protein